MGGSGRAVVVRRNVGVSMIPDTDHRPYLLVLAKCRGGGLAFLPFLHGSGRVLATLDVSTDSARLEFFFHAFDVAVVHLSPVEFLILH